MVRNGKENKIKESSRWRKDCYLKKLIKISINLFHFMFVLAWNYNLLWLIINDYDLPFFL